MMEWLSIPRLIDFILVGLALEALWLLARHFKKNETGVPPMFLHIVSGGCLLLAMKLSLTSHPTTSVALIMGAAGVTHVADLALALRKAK